MQNATTRDDAQTSSLRTEDIDAAAYLLSEGARLVAVEPAANGYSSFLIEGDDARTLEDRYAHGGILVDLDRFLAARRLILDRIARARRLAPRAVMHGHE